MLNFKGTTETGGGSRTDTLHEEETVGSGT